MDSNDHIARYVVMLEIDSVFVAHDDSIEYVCAVINEYIAGGDEQNSVDAVIRPLSSVVAC